MTNVDWHPVRVNEDSEIVFGDVPENGSYVWITINENSFQPRVDRVFFSDGWSIGTRVPRFWNAADGRIIIAWAYCEEPEPYEPGELDSDMSWMSEQYKYREEREFFENSYSGQLMLAEQRDDFLNHTDELSEVAKRIDEAVHNGELKENGQVYIFFYERQFPERSLELLNVVLRDDGFAYFGKNEAIAILGLGGRFKDGQFEFYEQYKDLIDAYATGARQ